MEEQEELMSAELDMGTLREFVFLSKRKEELESNLENVKKRLGELKVELSEQFVNAGVQNVQVDGKKVYLARNLWARFITGDSEAEAEMAVRRLREHNLGWMVKPGVNSQTLSAWVREREAEMGLDYDAFQEYMGTVFGECVKISEVFDIRAVSAQRK